MEEMMPTHESALTESEINNIIKTLPSSRDRLRLMTHLSIVGGWNVDTSRVRQSNPQESIGVVTRITATPWSPPEDALHMEGPGGTWYLTRDSSTTDSCLWVLYDPQGVQRADGEVTSGKDVRALRDNARKQGKRAFDRISK